MTDTEREEHADAQLAAALPPLPERVAEVEPEPSVNALDAWLAA